MLRFLSLSALSPLPSPTSPLRLSSSFFTEHLLRTFAADPRVIALVERDGGPLRKGASVSMLSRSNASSVGGVGGVGGGIESWMFPRRMGRVASIYGVLDQQTWKNTAVGFVLQFCVRCYTSNTARGNGVKAIGETVGDIDVENHLDHFPNTLLICGEHDGLLKSSERLHARLTARGHRSRMISYPGPHAFHGIPVNWTCGMWRTNALPATLELLDFFTGTNMAKDGTIDRVPRIPFDWTLPLTLVLVAMPPAAFVSAVKWIVPLFTYAMVDAVSALLWQPVEIIISPS